MNPLKWAVLAGLTHASVLGILGRFRRESATILMMHRFADRELGVPGHDIEQLRTNLAYLRKRKYEVVRVDELVRRFDAGEEVHRCVAFTVDDGYADFSRVAAPVFEEFDCPVTVYVASAFLDGTAWYWWDKVEFMITHSRRGGVHAPSTDVPVQLDLTSPTGRDRSIEQTVAWGKGTSEAALTRSLGRLAEFLGIEVPEKAPPQYAAMTWSECRRLEALVTSFGPHTVSHPVLSQVPDDRAWYEMTESWARLSAEVAAPVPVFCYPYGSSDSFSARDVRAVARMGMLAAVSSQPGQVFHSDVRGALSRFALPRYAYLDAPLHFRQIISGLEHLKSRLRSSGRVSFEGSEAP